MKRYIFFIIFIFFLNFINAEDNNLTFDSTVDLIKRFNEEKLSYIVKKRFNELYPLDVVDFYFYKGEDLISFEEFINITNDPLYFNNLETIKKTKIVGATIGIIFGSCTLAFMIPSAILITNAVSYNLTVELKSNYFMSGVVSVVLSFACAVGGIIDLIVTFSLLHQYENNENLYKKIIERYNNKLKKSLILTPDISFYNNDIGLLIKIKI